MHQESNLHDLFHKERLLKMKTAVRIFALLVAFAGLASASFSNTANPAVPAHMSSAVSGPSPMGGTDGTGGLPAPLPCQSNGSCVAPAQ